MVMRRSVGQVMDQQNEKKEYFNSKYSFSKVAGLEAGKEVYCIPLNLENGLYENARHIVKARGPKQGFKGWYSTSIKCKGVNEDGTKNPDALCCQLAQAEYDKHPGTEDYGKRMMSFTSYVTYIPVLILGSAETTKGALKFPPTKLTLKNYQFAYLEMATSSFNKDILTPFINKMKDDGVIDYEAEGEELKTQVMEQLQKTIIKVSAVKSDKKNLPYERSYSFIPFSNTAIGKETEQYKYIVNYKKVTKVNNDIVDFITLFDSEVDGLCTDWTDEELDKYINIDSVRSAKVAEAVEAADAKQTTPKAEQVVTKKATTEPSSDLIGEDEVPFGDDEFGPLEDEVATQAVTDDFGDIDDSEFQMDTDEDSFLDEEGI